MERKIGFELREIQQSIKHKIERERIEHGIALTHGQVRVLMFIHQNKRPSYQRDIEDFLKIRRSTATEILNVLERDGYLNRVRCEHDARLKEIVLTHKTLEVVDEMSLRLVAMETSLRNKVDPKDLETFFKVLDQMKVNINEETV